MSMNVIYQPTTATDLEARQKADQAEKKADDALQELADLSELAHQDHILVEQIADPQNLPNNGGGIDTSEVEASLALTTWELSGGAFVDAGPRTMDPNLLVPSSYRAGSGTGTISAATLLGQDAHTALLPADDDSIVFLDGVAFTTAGAGEAFYGALAVKPVASLTSFKLLIYHPTRAGDTVHLWVDLPGGYTSGIGAADTYWEDPFGKAGTYVADLGGGVYGVYFEFVSKAAITDSFLCGFRVNGTDAATEIDILPAYFGRSPVYFEVSNGNEVFTAPGATSKLVLSADGYQKKTIASGDHVLELPAAPSADVREIVLRVDVTGGLVAASAFVLYALSVGVDGARNVLRVEPRTLLGTGMAFAVGTGLLALTTGHAFLQSLWVYVPIPGLDEPLKLGSTLIFDIGVMFAVVGTVLLMVFSVEDRVPGLIDD